MTGLTALTVWLLEYAGHPGHPGHSGYPDHPFGVRVVRKAPSLERSYSRRTLILIGAGAVGALAYLYRDVVVGMVRVWSTDDYFSHGFLIPPIAAFLAWERRDRFQNAPIKPSPVGLVFVIAGILALAPGVPVFLTRVSLVFAIAAVVLMFFGWSRLRIVAFPFAILLLMIPLPGPVFERIEFPGELLRVPLEGPADRRLGALRE